MPLGLYISVPFCRTKCTYCNFASDVFSRSVFDRYVDRVCFELNHAPQLAAQMGGSFEAPIDSVYLGGGTPTVLDATQFERLFVTIRQNFLIAPDVEVTVECAPGTLNPALLGAFGRCGVNRVSLGVQSFVDGEAASVGRLHKRQTVLDDIANLRSVAISNINVDLIAGLPHQTAESWPRSLQESVATGVPHVSVYMLEVDEDSRLGREVMAGGTKYHAHFVPDDEAIADFYLAAGEQLSAAGVVQYEISNFALAGFESRHNLKYWTRQPYLGCGVDAHSMLKSADPACAAVRFSNPEALEEYVAAASPSRSGVSPVQALEESLFLGLRLTRGVDLDSLATEFGDAAVAAHALTIRECEEAGLIEREHDLIRLTSRGRLLSNEVFARFIADYEPAQKAGV
jgi:oxygen-independent coproporphyrinogen III oxidase